MPSRRVNKTMSNLKSGPTMGQLFGSQHVFFSFWLDGDREGEGGRVMSRVSQETQV